MPHPIWRSKAGSHEPDPPAGVIYLFIFLPRPGLRVDLAGPLTAISFITEIRGTVFYEGRKVGRVVFL